MSQMPEDVQRSLLRDQRFILTQSQEELEENLDLLGSDLIEFLVGKRVLNEDEATIITKPQDEKNQVHMLVNRMMRKTSQQFNTFCSCLDKSGLGELREQLLSYTVIERCILEVQEKLAKYFLESYSQVDMLSLFDDGYRVQMDKIYVPVKWVTYTREPDDVGKRKLQEYTDLLQGNESRILIHGEPMAGKTTFSRKISYDWAKALNVKQSMEEQNIPLGNFLLCLPINLGLVAKGLDLLQTVNYQMDFLEKRDIRTIEWLLDQDPSKVLMVFDGLDEYNLETSRDLTNVIIQKSHRNCCCIVTSRDEGVRKIEKWKTVFTIDAEIEGFDDTQIKTYVNNYFGKNCQAKGLLSLIFKAKSHMDKVATGRAKPTPLRTTWNEAQLPDESDSDSSSSYSTDEDSDCYLYEMACNPGRLGILCRLWKANMNIGEDKGTLYKELICLLLKLAEKRLCCHNDKTRSKDLILIYHEQLLKFGKLALQRDDDGLMQTAYTLLEVEALVGPEAMKYGFLYRSHPLSRAQYSKVSFIHKTVQEWMAAYYICHTEAWEELVYDHFCTFIADRSLHQFILSYNPENLYNLCSCLIPEKSCMLTFKEILSLGRSVNMDLTLGDILKRIQPTADDESREKRGGSTGVALGKLLLTMRSCTVVDLGKCGLDAAQIADLVDTLGNTTLPTLQVDLFCNNLSGAGDSLGRLLLLMPSCTVLKLELCNLTTCDLADVESALGNKKVSGPGSALESWRILGNYEGSTMTR